MDIIQKTEHIVILSSVPVFMRQECPSLIGEKYPQADSRVRGGVVPMPIHRSIEKGSLVPQVNSSLPCPTHQHSPQQNIRSVVDQTDQRNKDQTLPAKDQANAAAIFESVLNQFFDNLVKKSSGKNWKLPEAQIGLPSLPQREADKVFETLLQEFFREAVEKAKSGEKKSRKMKRSDSGEIVDTIETKKKWAVKVQEYTKESMEDESAYLASFAAGVDYGKLFDYLGKLKTAENIYADQYQRDEKELNRRFHNDGVSLFDREVAKVMVIERHKLLGMGFMEQPDPFVHEQMKYQRLLMHEDGKKFRQDIAFATG